MNVINEVYDSLRWKKNDEFCADKLGMTLEKYQEVKAQILEVKNLTREETDEMMKNIISARLLQLSDEHYNTVRKTESEILQGLKGSKEKVIEFKEDLENGTALIKGIASAEPRSPEEIIRVLKIDTNKWKLGVYWNKEQPSTGLWVVSAQVSLKKPNEVTFDDVEQILANVFAPKKFSPIVSYPQISNQKALFVYISDRHIGAYVSNVAMYENEYSSTNYESRMNLLLHEIIYQQQVFGRFEDIYVIDLGDKMDGLNGQTTRGGHRLPQNMSNRQAFETAVRVDKEFFDKLIQADLANNYHLYQNTNSNHGGDFDYMVNRALEIYINTQYPDVETRILERFVEHMFYGKHCLLLTHGKDDEDMKHGLPLHLNDKTENYFRKYLMYHKIDPEEYRISIVKGDLHQSTSQETYGFRYRNVLSLFGGSKWIGTNFGPNAGGCSFEIIEAQTDRIFESTMSFS
jgi:hypothetical protein